MLIAIFSDAYKLTAGENSSSETQHFSSHKNDQSDEGQHFSKHELKISNDTQHFSDNVIEASDNMQHFSQYKSELAVDGHYANQVSNFEF